MVNISERPRCRQDLLKIAKRENCSVEELLSGDIVFLSHNMHLQARRMVIEARTVILRQPSDTFFEGVIGDDV